MTALVHIGTDDEVPLASMPGRVGRLTLCGVVWFHFSVYDPDDWTTVCLAANLVDHPDVTCEACRRVIRERRAHAYR